MGTEDCFQKTPLPFTGFQSFLWEDGTQVFFPGTYVTEGTVPKGSAWAMNPIPRNDTSNSGQSFPPRCEEVPDCGSTLVNSKCLCSGMWGPYGLQIIDTRFLTFLRVTMCLGGAGTVSSQPR